MLCLDEPSSLHESTEAAGKNGGASSDNGKTELTHRKVVIVGIPGVGKSSVVKKALELMSARKMETKVVNYGTVMMEEASTRYGVKSRDDMRRLPVEVQRKLQIYAASRIASIPDERVIIDTHLFVSTKEGYWPGMPMDVLNALKPTHLVLISATAEEIRRRRENDETRARDKSSIETVQLEVDAARTLLFTSSLICGCPALVASNSDGQIEDAAKRIINSAFQD